ncbi:MULTISPECIES: conjugative transposon protein TraN [Empedobacter]|uniref:Conjugative transposon protein TraN n=1 Tax=Empedobacter falsenii TaxID=343874 RepID=A0AAW7DFR5_9FLAO|nr:MULTISPECIES: conjugative transposon protein TraN [Empedobacter]MDM1550488.1 conjugative transposon protein TraN [Empedobacter falsenii]
MKINYKHILFLILILGVNQLLFAQDSVQNALKLAKIEPYLMNVTYDKTSHLIFPSNIRYVDLGSDFIIAEKADDAENVLRIKAAIKDFEPETNFSVITNDGKFYNFNVYYSPYPENLSYNLFSMKKELNKVEGNKILFNELGNQPASLTDLIMETIYQNNKSIIKHIGIAKFGIQFILKGLYNHEGNYYFHLEMKNRSNVPFDIDFIHFKIAEKKLAKRSVIQNQILKPLRSYQSLDSIKGKSIGRNVFLLDQFTLTEDLVLFIEIYEKNGGRNQTLQVENSDLIHAQLIDEMHLKF